MDNTEIVRRFRYYPADEARGEVHAHVRAKVMDLALDLNGVVPEGREKAVMLTKLEEAMFWANAAVARQ
jgi:hypothetical protein